MSKGKLYLIPSPLGEGDPADVLPAPVIRKACELKCYVVEELRTARRFLSAYGLRGHIEELEFHELNEHTTKEEVEALLPLFDKSDVGLMTEAGLPAVADPGSALVELCHKNGIQVVPFVGPSSLMLALMASGLNGQSFAFKGYIPAKTDLRRAALKDLEKLSARLDQSQILIETPYRNDSLFADMLSTFADSTRVCVAANITAPDEFILTQSVSEWKKKQGLCIGKRPCIFIVLA